MMAGRKHAQPARSERTLFDGLGGSIQDRFTRFCEEHPDVPRMFVEIALDLRRRGHQRYSADGICHVIRWHRATSGQDAEGLA